MQNSMPEELITKILSKLPTKPLLRFGCTLKSWLALIVSPEFVKTHLSFSTTNKEYTHHKVMMRCTPKYGFKNCTFNSLFNESFTKAKDLDYVRQVPYGISIAGSVNGLICLVIQNKELILWNPSTRKYKKFPHPETTLGYGPRPVYGFGYDEFHDDYKIVVIFSEHASSPQIEVKIYSLKSDSWRIFYDCPSMVPLPYSGKFENGKLHWASIVGKMNWATTTSHNQCTKRSIISIDLADDKWAEMEQPCHGEGNISLRLGVLGSNFSVFCNCNKTYLDVWVMKEYGVEESWIKMHSIKYPEDPLGYGVEESWIKMHSIKYPEDPLGYGDFGKRCVHMENEGEILVVFGSTFMIYNPKGDPLRYPKIIKLCDEAEIYIESLVCPFSMVGTEDATKEGDEKAQIKTIE